MEIFKAAKERLGFNFRRCTTILVLSFIVLAVLVRVFVSYQDSAFDLIGGLAKAKVSPANTQDVAALGFGKTVTLFFFFILLIPFFLL